MKHATKRVLSFIVMLTFVFASLSAGIIGTMGVSTAKAADATGTPASYPPFAGKIGVGVSLGATSRVFVDVAKTLRAWEAIPGGPAATDASGWPTTDAKTVFFDMRPTCAWLPEGPDDPDRYQNDMSGTYKLSFTGQADMSTMEGEFSITNKAYDAATNTTTADLTVAPGKALVVVAFTNTKRLPTDTTSTGITNLKLIRPGYAANAGQTFTNEFVNALQPFSTLRFMGWCSTNDNSPPVNADGTIDPNLLTRWADRKLPTDATQEAWGTKKDGGAWEYIVELANLANKDIWVNVPVAADDDYVTQLATMLKEGLNPGIKVYVEYSNEVWNTWFSEGAWNTAAAVTEVNSNPNSNLKRGSTDTALWARTRYARRVYEISNIFASVYGQQAINNTVRVVFCGQIGNDWTRNATYTDPLNWLKDTYGDPKNYIFAIAGAPYFNTSGASPTASVSELLAAMRASSDDSAAGRANMTEIANSFELKNFCYEGGSDTGGGDPTNVANRIRAERSPGMKDLMIHDLRNNWFPLGGDLFMYLELSSYYSRYGGWGLTEDISNTNTYKLQAVNDLLNNANPVPSSPVVKAEPASSQVSLSWETLYYTDGYHVKRSTTSGGPYTVIGTTTNGSYVDTTAKNGRTYYYVVTAFNANGESSNSPEVSAMPEPAMSYFLNEDFNSQTAGQAASGWTITGNASATIANVPSTTNKSMLISNPGWVDTAASKSFNAQTGITNIEFSFNPQGDGSGAIISVGDGSKSAITFFHFWDWLNYGVWGSGLLKVYPGTWYRIKIVADIPNRKADIYINDALYMDDQPFLDGSVDKIDTISFGGISWATWAGAYYDDIKVYSDGSVTGVFLDTNEAEIPVNSTLQLSAVVTPLKAANRSVTWASSDTSVATVDSNGLVTGVGGGTATITVTSAEGGFTDTCAVTVLTAPMVLSKTISYINSLNLPYGATNSLTSKLANANASLHRGNSTAASDMVNAFINEVEAKRGNDLTNAQADELVSKGQLAISLIG